MEISKRSFLRMGLISAAALPVMASAGGGDRFQPVWVDSLKVNAQGSKGQTAHREIPISAGPDRVFIPDSIRFREESRSGGGRVEAYFRKDRFKYRKVPTTVAGAKYVIDMPYEIVIVLHAETGSGSRNWNRGAWLNGYVEAQTIEVDR